MTLRIAMRSIDRCRPVLLVVLLVLGCGSDPPPPEEAIEHTPDTAAATVGDTTVDSVMARDTAR